MHFHTLVLTGGILLSVAQSLAAQVIVERQLNASRVLPTRSVAVPTLPETTLHPALPQASGPRSLSFNLPAGGHFQAQPLNTTHPTDLPSFQPQLNFRTLEHSTAGALTEAGLPRVSLPSSAYVAPPPGSRVSHGASWIMLDVGNLEAHLPRQDHATTTAPFELKNYPH